MFKVLWLGWWFCGRRLFIFLLLRKLLRSVGSLHSRLAFRHRRRNMKAAIVNGDVGLDLFVGNLLPVLTALYVYFHRVWQIPTGDFLIVTQRGLVFALSTTNHSPGLNLNRNVVVRIHVVVTNVATRQGQFEFESVCAFDRLHAHKLHRVSLLLVVDQRPVEIRVLEDLLHLFLTERLWLFLALKGCNLPPGLAVVSVDSRQPLERKFPAPHISALVLLHNGSLKAATQGKLARATLCLHRLNFRRPTDGFDIFRDDLFRGLSRGRHA